MQNYSKIYVIMCKLSVITVNLNNVDGLRKTMMSVFCQTYKDFEFIIIDGGSIDGSLQLLKSSDFERYDYKWISEIDSGIYNAMNKGIALSKGEYLLFLNSGDFFLNEKVLSEVFDNFDFSQDLICARCEISKNGNVVHITNPPAQITFRYLYNTGLNHQSTFIKRDLFEKFGYYREDFKYHSDTDFWYKTIIFGNASSINVDTILINYNLEGASEKFSNTIEFKNEQKIILSNPILQKFIPDYESWKKKDIKLQKYYWLINKKIGKITFEFIYFGIKIIYKIASIF